MRTTLGTLWLLALLSGCWVGASEVDDKLNYVDVDESLIPQRVGITEVAPPFGTSAGGNDVEVFVDTPLGEGVRVFFGAEEATVKDIDDARVLVETPPGADVVDVHLEWGAKAGRLDDAFTYYADATGLYGVVGSLSYYDVVGPLASMLSDAGIAWMNFVTPSEYGYADLYGPGLDTCVSGWDYPGDLTEIASASQVDLASVEGDHVTMPWSVEAEAYAADLLLGGGTDGFRIDTTYDLQTLDAPGLPPLFVKGLVHTSGPFRVFTDCSLGLCEPHAPLDGDTTPIVFQSDLILEWDHVGEGGADYMVVRLELWEKELVEQVRCLLRDDGVFEVPSTVWQSSPDFRSLDIYMGRVHESAAVLPHNGAATGVAGVYWTVGTTAVVPL